MFSEFKLNKTVKFILIVFLIFVFPIRLKFVLFSSQKKDTYTLTIEGTDLDGASNGNKGRGTAIIKILDVNDNIPTLEKNFVRCLFFLEYHYISGPARATAMYTK